MLQLIAEAGAPVYVRMSCSHTCHCHGTGKCSKAVAMQHAKTCISPR